MCVKTVVSFEPIEHYQRLLISLLPWSEESKYEKFFPFVWRHAFRSAFLEISMSHDKRMFDKASDKLACNLDVTILLIHVKIIQIHLLGNFPPKLKNGFEGNVTPPPPKQNAKRTSF